MNINPINTSSNRSFGSVKFFAPNAYELKSIVNLLAAKLPTDNNKAVFSKFCEMQKDNQFADIFIKMPKLGLEKLDVFVADKAFTRVLYEPADISICGYNIALCSKNCFPKNPSAYYLPVKRIARNTLKETEAVFQDHKMLDFLDGVMPDFRPFAFACKYATNLEETMNTLKLSKVTNTAGGSLRSNSKKTVRK